MIYQHMRFTGAAMLPTGDFLAHVVEWTDSSPAELLGLMRGSAPVSAGASAELRAPDRCGPRGALSSRGARVRGRPRRGPPIAALPPGRRGRRRGRLPRPRRLPASGRLRHLRAVRARAARMCSFVRSGRPSTPRHPARRMSRSRRADVRSRVPEPHRAQFDELLEEARLTYRIRDERGVFSDIWASGIMRRAALAAGRRLAERGRILAPEHFVEAGPRGDARAPGRRGRAVGRRARRSGSSTASPTARRTRRNSWAILRRHRRTPRACRRQREESCARSGSPSARSSAARRRRTRNASCAGSQRARGSTKDRREGCSGPAEFDRIAEGRRPRHRVARARRSTSCFPLLGALVTDSGGLLSHAAIVAREYGIPGVVGTREATERIADGVAVRVDGDAGEVTVIG